LLIVLEGIDGSGKSTLAPLICERLRPPQGNARPLLKKFVDYDDRYSRGHLRRLRHVIWGERKPKIDAMGGEHWVLLIAAWYAALSRRLLPGISDTLVSDGWWFRNVAKSIEDAALDETWVRALFSPVASPDLTILIDIDPTLVLKRVRRFDHRELGGWAQGGPTDFVSYQSRIRKRLRDMAVASGWFVVEPRATEEAPELADRIVTAVHRQLGWGPARA